jgi:hypothetical protein
MKEKIYTPVDEVVQIRIYGQIVGPMNNPEPYTTIILKAISTNWEIIQDTTATTKTDQNGNYDFSVYPGKYAVFFERQGLKKRINDIQVYSDSESGPLQDFMLTPAASDLTPLIIRQAIAAAEQAAISVLRSRQWAENPEDVPVVDFEQGAGPEYSAYHWAKKAQEKVDTDTNINWRGEWDASTLYFFRDAVQYEGSSYYCILENTGTAPPDVDTEENDCWSLMAEKGGKGDKGDAGSVITVNDIASDGKGNVQLGASDVDAVSAEEGGVFKGPVGFGDAQTIQIYTDEGATASFEFRNNGSNRLSISGAFDDSESGSVSQGAVDIFYDSITKTYTLQVSGNLIAYNFNPQQVLYNRFVVLNAANARGLLTESEVVELENLLSQLITDQNNIQNSTLSRGKKS